VNAGRKAVEITGSCIWPQTRFMAWVDVPTDIASMLDVMRQTGQFSEEPECASRSD